MKPKRWMGLWAGVLGAGVLAVVGTTAVRAAEVVKASGAAKTAKPEGEGAGGGAAEAKGGIPKSVFLVDPNGRNPFNPRAPSPSQQAEAAKPAPPPLRPEETIQFKGVTGTGANRVALINTVPMRPGEKMTIRGSDGSQLEWELVEILDDEVVLKYGEQTYRKKIADRFLQLNAEQKGTN